MENLRPAIVASTIANVNAGKGRAFKPFDFVPKFEARGESEENLNARILAALPVETTT